MTDSQDDLLKEIGTFLATCRTASLATAGADGTPHAANVQFATDSVLRLYWVSSPDSLHSVHLLARPRVAVTVYAHDDRAPMIHGVQMHGEAKPIVDEGDAEDAFELYTTKYAFAAALPQFREMIEKQRFYVFTPTWVRWIDNRRGFGFRREATLRR